MQESLRKYSVVPVVTRRVEEDTTLCGFSVPEGAYVAIMLQVCWLTSCRMPNNLCASGPPAWRAAQHRQRGGMRHTRVSLPPASGKWP